MESLLRISVNNFSLRSDSVGQAWHAKKVLQVRVRMFTALRQYAPSVSSRRSGLADDAGT